MNIVAKCSIAIAFSAAAVLGTKAGFEYLIEHRAAHPVPVVPVNSVAETKIVPPTIAQNAPEISPVPEVAAQEAPKPLPETDIALALSMASLGQISFEDDKVTVTVLGQDSVSAHDFVYDFNGAGAICDEASPVCAPMTRLNAEEKQRLDSSICERALWQGGGAFYQEYCALK